MIANCVQHFESNINSLLPVPESDASFRAITEQWAAPQGDFLVSVKAVQNGYVQTINYSSFLNQSATEVAGCELHVRSGDHVLCGEALFTIHCRQPVSEADFTTLRQAVVLGANRTPIQDPEFAISQLVEIALRALSPGINDPHTAITCVDKLTAICVQVASREFPAENLIHTSSEVWLKRRTFTFAGVVDKAYSQVRQSANDQIAVLIHLLKSLAKLQQSCAASEQKTITHHAQSIAELVRALTISVCDQQAIEEAMLPFA